MRDVAELRRLAGLALADRPGIGNRRARSSSRWSSRPVRAGRSAWGPSRSGPRARRAPQPLAALARSQLRPRAAPAGLAPARLPEDLVGLDELLCDGALLEPFVACWQREALVSGTSTGDHGRPTVAIETYVLLMVLGRHGGANGRWSRRFQTPFNCGASAGSR